MAPDSAQRRLAAILSADVFGFSRLMAEDEVATTDRLREYRSVFHEFVGRHHGRIVDDVGDAVLAEFPSVVDAVRSAVELQRELARRNAELVPARRMQFRLGINLGEVIADGDRISGTGVNIAARIQTLAPPGGVTLSASAFEQVEDSLEVPVESKGEHRLKNIPKPVRVYQLGDLDHPTTRKATTSRLRRRLMATAGGIIVAVVAAILLYDGTPEPPARSEDCRDEQSVPIDSALPPSFLRETVEKITTASSSAQIDLAERFVAVEDILCARFDIVHMSRLILGHEMNGFSEVQRAEFERQLRGFLSRRFVEIFGLTSPHIELIKTTRELPDGELLIETRLLGGRYDEAIIAYRLRELEEQWRITDVLAEGVSAVSILRKSFQQVLQSESPEQLLTRLRHQDDLNTKGMLEEQLRVARALPPQIRSNRYRPPATARPPMPSAPGAYKLHSHRVVSITDEGLNPKVVTLQEGQLVAWINSSNEKSVVVFGREVAQPRISLDPQIKDDELRSAPIHADEFATFIHLKPGRYRYKIVRPEAEEEGIDGQFEGEIIVVSEDSE